MSDEDVEAWLRIGREAWPALAVPPSFADYIVARIPPHVPIDAAPERMPIADLYLACACAAGDPRAIEIIERDLLPSIVPAIRQLGATDTIVEEVLQLVRTDLFVAEPGTPAKIATYSGRGPLRSWLRAVAVKKALGALRARGIRELADDERLAELADAGDNPELQTLKYEYRVAFKRAFQTALANLPARDRMLIKQHHLDGLTVDRLGAIYSVDRATAARWLVAARATLFKTTRKELVRDLGLSGEELASVVRLVKSQIELSLHRLLPGDES